MQNCLNDPVVKKYQSIVDAINKNDQCALCNAYTILMGDSKVPQADKDVLRKCFEQTCYEQKEKEAKQQIQQYVASYIPQMGPTMYVAPSVSYQGYPLVGEKKQKYKSDDLRRIIEGKLMWLADAQRLRDKYQIDRVLDSLEDYEDEYDDITNARYTSYDRNLGELKVKSDKILRKMEKRIKYLEKVIKRLDKEAIKRQ